VDNHIIRIENCNYYIGSASNCTFPNYGYRTISEVNILQQQAFEQQQQQQQSQQFRPPPSRVAAPPQASSSSSTSTANILQTEMPTPQETPAPKKTTRASTKKDKGKQKEEVSVEDYKLISGEKEDES
jgi:hypothetical protein